MRSCGRARGGRPARGFLNGYQMFLKNAGKWPAVNCTNVQTAREAFFDALPSGASIALQAIREILLLVRPDEFEGDLLCKKHGR